MFKVQTCQSDFNRGLINCGNTCFINACLQCLWMIKDIWSVLDTGFVPSQIGTPKAQMLWELNSLRTALLTGSTPIQPDRFIACVRHVAASLGIKEFLLGQQCDAHEFLLFLIDILDSTIITPVNMAITGTEKNSIDIIAKKCYQTFYDQYRGKYSIVAELLSNIQVSALYEPQTSEIISSSLTSQVSSVLSLQLPSTKITECSIYDCLSHYCCMERLEGENSWFDEDRKVHRAVDKKIDFWSLPKILIIHINRWTIQGTKRDVSVTFPLTNLDFSSYVIGYNKSSYIYDLFAVCYHHGSEKLGHYTSCCLTSAGVWLHYDDANVSKVDSRHVVNRDSYILFYRKK